MFLDHFDPNQRDAVRQRFVKAAPYSRSAGHLCSKVYRSIVAEFQMHGDWCPDGTSRREILKLLHLHDEEARAFAHDILTALEVAA